MFNLFGSKTKKAASPPADSFATMTKLDEDIKLLTKREENLLQQCENMQKEAIFLAKEKKDEKGAMHRLTKKKKYMLEVDKMRGAITMLDNQTMALQSATTNQLITSSLAQANSAMKSQTRQLDVEKVQDVMDEAMEQQQQLDEIGQLLAQPAQEAYDDDEVKDELADLLKEEEESNNVTVPGVGIPSMPSVPQGAPTTVFTQATANSSGEEDEDVQRQLRELEASMA